MEAETMNKLVSFCERKSNNLKTEEQKHNESVAAFIEKVNELQPRINTLCEIGEFMLSTGIPLGFIGNGGYARGNYMADGINHQFGFFGTSYVDFHPTEITGIGVDFYTDEEIRVNKNELFISDKIKNDKRWFNKFADEFIEKFPQFEKAVFDYIEKLDKQYR